MATNGCVFVRFLDIYENAFYFGVSGKDEDIVGDSTEKHYFIRSNDNKFLILNENDHFEAKNLTIREQSQEDCTFHIREYDNYSCQNRGNEARAVMLYIIKDGKTMVACCTVSGIHPETMNLPGTIGEGHLKAVFFLRSVRSNTVMFESCMYKNKFLGFDSDENNSGLSKLVLHLKVDEPDEACEVFCDLKTS